MPLRGIMNGRDSFKSAQPRVKISGSRLTHMRPMVTCNALFREHIPKI